MADEVDVEQVLLGIIVGALYPNGTSQTSAAGVACNVFRGWPTVQQAEAAKIAAAPATTTSPSGKGLVNVSITTRSGAEKNTSRYPFTWQTSVAPVHTLTVTVNNNVITLSGTVAVPQNVLILIGIAKVYNYAVQANDTLSTIASALATLINADFSGTSSNGAVITVASTSEAVKARIASSGTALQEVARQEKVFQISIWAPPYNVAGQDADTWRTAVAKIIDPALKQLIRIVLPDQTYAHIHYDRTIVMDGPEMQGLYRRDLYFWVEYGTTITQTAYEIGDAQTQLTGGVTTDGDMPPVSGSPTITNNS